MHPSPLPSGISVPVFASFPDAAQGAWDAFVAQHPAAHFLQTSSWGRLKSRFGWDAQRIAVEDSAHHIIAGAQCLFTRRHGLAMAYVPRGPLVNWDDIDQLIDVRDRLVALARARNAHFLKIEPELEDLPVNRLVLRQLGFRPSAVAIQPRSTIRVDLTASEDAILARMKSKWRYNIRKARRSGVQIQVGSLDDIETFQALMAETGAKQGFHPHNAAYHKAALELLGPDRVRLLLARVEREVVAALVAVAVGRGAWYPWGGRSARHAKAMPNFGLHYAAMTWARAQGAACYDLWGIPQPLGDLARHIRWFGESREWPHALPVSLAQLPQRDLWSVYRMKQGFGGQIVQWVGAWDLPIQPAAYRLFSLATDARSRARRLRQTATRPRRPAPARAADRRAYRWEQETRRARWNRELARQPAANFMQSWEWGDVKARFGWTPLRYRLRAADGACQGVLQILVKRIHPWLPGKLAYVPRGPAIDWTDLALADYALQAVEDIARRHGCVGVRIDPNVRRDQAHGLAAIARLEERGWHFSPRPTQLQNTGYSPLPAKAEELMASFQSRCRNCIRVAQRRGLVVRRGGLDDLPQFYDLYADTGRRKGFPIRSLDYYQTVFAQCHGSAARAGLRCALLLAEDQEVGVVGAAFVLALGAWAWYLYGASNAGKAAPANPNPLLQWEAMRWATAQGCRHYDWWGAPLDPDDETDPFHGVWRFKRKFGAQFAPLIGAWDRLLVPGAQRVSPRLLRAGQRLREGSPRLRGILPV